MGGSSGGYGWGSPDYQAYGQNIAPGANGILTNLATGVTSDVGNVYGADPNAAYPTGYASSPGGIVSNLGTGVTSDVGNPTLPYAAGGGRNFFDRATDWLGSERGQRAMQQLGGWSAGMLQGSSPSLTPRNFSTGLGAAMTGMQQAGSQYYQDALHRAQAEAAQQKLALDRSWNDMLQQDAANATGRPPGGMPGAPGAPASGGGVPPIQAPASAGGGGAPAGDFATYAPLIQKYESRGRPYIGTGETDLTNRPRDPETGFPQWQGKVVGTKADGSPLYSTAAGLYQITQSTWDPIARELGIKDFSPESQQRVAETLYARRGLDPWLPYNKNLSAAIGRGEAPNPFGQAPPIGSNLPSTPNVPPIPPSVQAGSPIDPKPPVGGLAARFPGVAAARPGLLPPAAPPPVVTVPPAQAAAPVRPVAPAAATAETPARTGSSAPAAVIAEGAGNLATVNRNLETNPDYYKGAVVALQPTGNKLDKLPDQIDRIKEAGGQPVLQAAIGSNATQNIALARVAAKKGVPYRGPDGESSGSSFPVGTSTGTDPGAGQPDVPAVAPAATTAAPPAPPPPITAGPMSTPVAAAPAVPVARPGGPMSLPGGVPYGAPPSAPPAPAPGATTAPPGPPPPSPAAATAGPAAGPNVMPSAITPPPVAAPPQPLPMPNLGQVQMPGAGGIPPYDVEAARRAQRMSIIGAATGHPVPAYMAEQANLPNKAVEQQWQMQQKLYGAQLDAARAQWQSMSDLQKEQYSAQNGLTKSAFESQLRKAEEDYKAGLQINPQTRQVEQRPGYAPSVAAIAGATETAKQNAIAAAEYDKPREYKVKNPDGSERTFIASPRQMGAAPPSTALGVSGAPGGGYQSEVAPGRKEELTGEGKRLAEVATQIHTEANTAKTGRADLDMLSAQGPNIAMPGPLAPYAQMFNRVALSVAGINAPQVSSYEMAQNLMGGMMRTALRQSDPNPTERQQAQMLASMPTPESSPAGFQQGIRHMQGLADWRIYREQALINHQKGNEGSAAGFEDSFKMSAIPFVVDRMTPSEKTAYFAQINKNDPSGETMDRLVKQLRAVKAADYSYRY